MGRGVCSPQANLCHFRLCGCPCGARPYIPDILQPGVASVRGSFDVARKNGPRRRLEAPLQATLLSCQDKVPDGTASDPRRALGEDFFFGASSTASKSSTTDVAVIVLLVLRIARLAEDPEQGAEGAGQPRRRRGPDRSIDEVAEFEATWTAEKITEIPRHERRKRL